MTVTRSLCIILMVSVLSQSSTKSLTRLQVRAAQAFSLQLSGTSVSVEQQKLVATLLSVALVYSQFDESQGAPYRGSFLVTHQVSIRFRAITFQPKHDLLPRLRNHRTQHKLKYAFQLTLCVCTSWRVVPLCYCCKRSAASAGLPFVAYLALVNPF